MPKNTNVKQGVIIGIVVLCLGIGFAMYRSRHTGQTVGWESRKAEMQALDEELHVLANQVKSLQGNGKCEYSGQCHMVGLGAKACDGYESYLIYAVGTINEDSLLQKVREFNTKATKLSELSLKAANCGVKPVEVHCVQNYCRPK